MIKITEKQRIILEALAHFKYLTTHHLKLIFNDAGSSSINQSIRKLKTFKKPLIKSIDFGLIAGFGRLSKIHILTKT